MASTKVSDEIIRRSGNYQPSIWNYDYIQSLRSEYEDDSYTERINKLKGQVGIMLEKAEGRLAQLELIDTLQRLGLAYHFEHEILRSLGRIYDDDHVEEITKHDDLYATALQFRLLRQNGHRAPQEVFDRFMDRQGKFKFCLCEDTKGLLALYEASFLYVEGENILEEAKSFTTEHLKEYVKQNKDDYLGVLVSHALEIPLHCRIIRAEARWFMGLYEKRPDMSPVLLELAKLDFNVAQAVYQADLRYLSMWWKNIGLGEKLDFTRDRLVESFIWTVGEIFEPHFEYVRRMLTKIHQLITTVDDVYDVYGTLDELELFTNAVERWDIGAMEQLPEYMKICFFALYNTINDIAFDALKKHGIHIISYLKKSWEELCKSYLLEAKWYYGGYNPTLEEYIDNAWISIGAQVVLVHVYFFVANPMSKEAVTSLYEDHNIIRWLSVIIRLEDDLGTSSDEMEKGDVPKSIQCYMREKKVSEEDARKCMREMIELIWKQINADQLSDSPFPRIFKKFVLNAARMAKCMYQHGDGHGVQDDKSKDRISSILIKPIPLL